MLIKLLAGAALVLFLFRLFRFAIGLRLAKLAREAERAAEQARGRRVVAEIPLDDGLVFFVEDAERFYWGENEVRKSALVGARMLLNGAVVGGCARPGLTLPEPPAVEEYEGRERWDVRLYFAAGAAREVPCGQLREGTSREIAAAVFGAVKAAVSDTQAQRHTD
jgi:hypothetical protein